MKHGAHSFTSQGAGSVGRLLGDYVEWRNTQPAAYDTFEVTSVEFAATNERYTLVVLFDYTERTPATGVTQRLAQPTALAPLPMYDRNNAPVIDEMDVNVNNRYVTACRLAQHHGRSEMFSNRGILSRAYFAGVSDALEAQADAASEVGG